MSATAWRRVQLALTLIWIVLIYPSVTWWAESLRWIVLMSAWANVASSAAGWMAARAEENTADKTDLEPIAATQARIEAKLDALIAASS